MGLTRKIGAALAICAAGCQSAPPYDNQAIARTLVGQWTYEQNEDGCRHTYLEAYRVDGTLTATAESCDITSDGFGNFRYGWYVAKGHICFVDIREQYEDNVKRPNYYR